MCNEKRHLCYTGIQLLFVRLCQHMLWCCVVCVCECNLFVLSSFRMLQPPPPFLPICWEDMPRQGICQAATAAHLTFVKCACQRAAISTHTQTETFWVILVLTLKDNRGGQI